MGKQLQTIVNTWRSKVRLHGCHQSTGSSSVAGRRTFGEVQEEVPFLTQLGKLIAPDTIAAVRASRARAPPADVDLSFIDDQAFWERVEEQVIEQGPRNFAQQAANGRTYTRRLFANDAVRGLAFMNILREPFTIVWMNPPFGAASKGARAYIEANYPKTKNDLYAAFVERGLELLEPRGLLGAITSRTGFFLDIVPPVA